MLRDYRPDDQGAVLKLADRLTVGMPPWREAAAVTSAVRGWVANSIDGATQGRGCVMVAVVDDEVVGFVSVGERLHFADAVDAYIGELVVADTFEGRGIGSALLVRAERWARERGYRRITLETGARNTRAMRLYEQLDWELEDVRMSKALS